jgi:AcrR family transcriptional regulator
VPSTRDAILDGALTVMRTRGLARSTTKEIARAAGYSEATLYKLFADKVDLFLCVLAERLPPVSVVRDGAASLAGRDSVAANLHLITTEITRFYLIMLPVGMSIFSDTGLLARHREDVRARGAGPESLTNGVRAYLAAEQAAGRVRADAPLAGAAMALAGACMQRAFLWCFDDIREPGDRAVNTFAADVVAAVLPSLTGGWWR